MNNNTVVQKTSLEIDNNIMKFGNTVVQLSNVCRYSFSPMPKNNNGIVILVMAFIGFMLMLTGIDVIVGVGGILLAFVFIGGVWWVIKAEKEEYYFLVELNSASRIYFSCSNKEFINQAVFSLTDCINGKRNCIINFDSCTIFGSQIGDSNKMDNWG